MPWTRKLVLVAFFGQLALAAGLFAGIIDISGHNDEWFVAYLALLGAAGLFIPWLLFRKRLPERRIGYYEAFAAVGMASSWIGAFGPYRTVSGYDTFVHVFCSALLGFVIIDALRRLAPRIASHEALLIAAGLVLTMLGGLGNELFEWGGDQLFGTMMYGEAGQPDDTTRDLIGNAVGFVIGALIAYSRRKSAKL